MSNPVLNDMENEIDSESNQQKTVDHRSCAVIVRFFRQKSLSCLHLVIIHCPYSSQQTAYVLRILCGGELIASG